MTIWEKAIINIQRGVQKLTVVAATFAERVRIEINIVRLRIRINEVQARLDELHRIIGSRLIDMKNRSEAPKTVEQFLQVEDIATALTEVVERTQELAELNHDIRNEKAAIQPVSRTTEDPLV